MSASATKTKAHETLMFLANFNSWRRGDETIEMPSPAEIGATIDDAINLLRKYDSAQAEVERLTKDRDDWKAKHWKAHDDYQRLFTEVPNLVARAERAEAEVSMKTDTLDLMRDEFLRIKACTVCHPHDAFAEEIADLCDRAIANLLQRVPVIVQRDKAEAELATLRLLHASEKQAKIERGDMLCECQAEVERLKALMRRALPTIESRITDYADEYKVACASKEGGE